jgi:hypothetical protein
MARAGLSLAAPVPRLALSIEEACAALGVGEDFWREHVAPEVRVVRRGRRKLVAITALEEWLAQHGERVLDDLATGKVAPFASESPANRGVRASRAPARKAA